MGLSTLGQTKVAVPPKQQLPAASKPPPLSGEGTRDGSDCGRGGHDEGSDCGCGGNDDRCDDPVPPVGSDGRREADDKPEKVASPAEVYYAVPVECPRAVRVKRPRPRPQRAVYRVDRQPQVGPRVVVHADTSMKQSAAMHLTANVVLPNSEGQSMKERVEMVLLDGGSPVSIIARHAVPRGTPRRPYLGRPLTWGQASPMRARHVVQVQVRVTPTNVITTDAVVVSNEQLPRAVPLLLGNNVIANVPADIVGGANKAGKQWAFPNGERASILSTREEVVRATTAVLEAQRQGRPLSVRKVAYEATAAAENTRRRVECRRGVCRFVETLVTAPRTAVAEASRDVRVPGGMAMNVLARTTWRKHGGMAHDDGSHGVVDVMFIPSRWAQARLGVAASLQKLDGGAKHATVIVPVFNVGSDDVNVRKGQTIGTLIPTSEVVLAGPSGGHGYDGAAAAASVQCRDEYTWDAEPFDDATCARAVTEPTERTHESPEAETPPAHGQPQVEPISEAFAANELADEWCENLDEPDEEAGGTKPVYAADDGLLKRDPSVGGGPTDESDDYLFLEDDHEARAKLDAAFLTLRVETERVLTDPRPSWCTEEQAREALELIERYKDVWVRPNMARADDEEYPWYLPLPLKEGSEQAVRFAPPFRYPPDKLERLHAWVEENLAKGHIEPANNTTLFNAPIVLARKKDGRFRFAIDLRHLNRMTAYEPYMLPRIPDLLDMTAGDHIFSAIDLKDGFWNILVRPDDREKLSFIVPHHGRYQWRSMPQGLHASSAHFQRAVEATMAGLSWMQVAVYVDDILIHTRTMAEHLVVLEQVLGRLKEAGFTAAPHKSVLFRDELPYLGFRLGREGLKVEPSYVAKVKERLIDLTTKKSARRAMGTLGFYSRFVPHMATIAEPITRLTKKGVRDDLSNVSDEAKEEAKVAAKRLATLITSAPTLALPDYNKEFVLLVDASDYGIGACLAQPHEGGGLRPVTLWSRKLSDTERKYSATEREALAIVYFLRKFRTHLLGRRFLLLTDHRALIYILQRGTENSKLARWALFVQEYDFDVGHVAGDDNRVADWLSRIGEEPSDFVQELNATVAGLYVRTRGVRGHEYDEVIIPAERWNIARTDGVGETSRALHWVHCDYQFPEVLHVKALQANDEECRDIRHMMVKREPESKRSATWLRSVRKAVDDGRLKVVKGVLFHLVDLFAGHENAERKPVPYLPTVFRRVAMYDNHDAPTAGHFGFKRTMKRLCGRYWWPTMRTDVTRWVESCLDCQRAGKGHATVMGFLHPVGTVTVPFERLVVDVVTVARGRHAARKAVVAMDASTRYAIVVPVDAVDAKTVADVLMDRVLTVYGPPRIIQTDNGPEFRNELVDQLSRLWGSQRSFSTPYHPRSQGLVERFNRTLLAGLRTLLKGEESGWQVAVKWLQFAYNSSMQASMGTSPYFLMFGREPTTPLEQQIIEVPSISGQPGYAEWIDTLRKAREAAREALEAAQNEQKKRYDAKRKPAERVQAGDDVWVLAHFTDDEFLSRKLMPRREGPYTVVDINEMGVAVLQPHHGANQKQVNVERLVRAVVRAEEPPTIEEEELLRWTSGTSTGIDEAPAVAREGPPPKDKEEADARVPDDVMEEEASHEDDATARVYEIKRIWARRLRDEVTQYLVEYEGRFDGVKRSGHWVDASDIEAPELLQQYIDHFGDVVMSQDQYQPFPPWKRRCQYRDVKDPGCEHLQCHHRSAMEAIKRERELARVCGGRIGHNLGGPCEVHRRDSDVGRASIGLK